MSTITVKDIVLENDRRLDDAVKSRVAEILSDPSFASALNSIKNQIAKHEHKPEWRYFDEWGDFIGSSPFTMPDLLEEEHKLVRETLFETFQDKYSISIRYDKGSKGWMLHTFFADPVVFNPEPGRNEYAIHSREHDLRVDRVESKEHGLALIEQAFRKTGIYSDVVRVDRYGTVFEDMDLSKVSVLTDEELTAFIESFENSEE